MVVTEEGRQDEDEAESDGRQGRVAVEEEQLHNIHARAHTYMRSNHINYSNTLSSFAVGSGAATRIFYVSHERSVVTLMLMAYTQDTCVELVDSLHKAALVLASIRTAQEKATSGISSKTTTRQY